ncbi:MAG: right-handed parallel beta-helix repeat-containing protein [Candidatus Thermoplasmatota archaeon]|nr:right-handed parallel beta-helix repeat-containing protein [Candidatus Thermoplasmatota archaeon]
MKKGILLIYVKLFTACLLLFGGVLSGASLVTPVASSNQDSFQYNEQILRGNKWYVGGSGPSNFSTIQSAINAASNGDSIIVYPGTYFENQITIDKALVIQGTGWTNTIIDGGRATLLSTGLVKITANGDVTFSGFTIRNAGGPTGYGAGDNKLNMGITACAGTAGVSYTITSNKIIGTNDPDDDYDYGFYAVSGGKENIIFTHNYVTQTGCNNIVIENTTGSTDLSHNNLDAGCWGIDSIYYMTYKGTDITTLQKVSNNTINVGTGINPGGSTYNKVTAIGFSSAYYGCTGVTDTGGYSHIVITDNTINNVKQWRRGIALDNFAWGDGTGGEIANAVICDNIINGVSSSPTSFGIRLSGLVKNTIICGNHIEDCDMGFWGRAGYYGSSTAYPTGTQMTHNSLLDNAGGVVWEAPTLLNARLNWWGSLQIEYPIVGSVDYSPWLGAQYGTSPMTYCTDDNIAEAINLTTVGETVFVCSGLYKEHLTLSKKISLIGEDCNTTIIDGSSVGKVVSITSDNVFLRGFTLQNSGIYEQDAGLYIRSNGNTITGNIMKENAEGIHLWDSTSNRIAKNTCTGCTYAMYLVTSDSNIIEDNSISDNVQGILLESSSDNDINRNYITNNKYGVCLGSYCNLNNIQNNQIALNTERGIYLDHLADKNNLIFHNNFIDNKVHAFFDSTFFSRWSSNYWDDWIGVKFPQLEMIPKIIIGRFFTIVPWINLDKSPSTTPYAI